MSKNMRKYQKNMKRGEYGRNMGNMGSGGEYEGCGGNGRPHRSRSGTRKETAPESECASKSQPQSPKGTRKGVAKMGDICV